MSNDHADETDTGDAGGDDGDGDGEAVTAEDVRHVAELARIDLDDSETDRFTEQFADILSYFETLDAVPDTDAEPDLVNVLRADEIQAGLDREAALENAAETEDGYFKGPRVS